MEKGNPWMKFQKTRFLWVGFIILLVILNLFLVFSVFTTSKELNLARNREKDLAREISELTAENRKTQDENVRLYDENKKLQISLAYYRRKALRQPRLLPAEIEELKGKGLKDPVKEIKTDLMQHNELIPYEGILGGVMRFSSEIDIYVLSTSMVRAYFEDGHIDGLMLLEYQVSDGGKIQWKVVDSYLDNPDNNKKGSR